MKKIIHLCVFMLTLLIWYGGRAQVASYGFSHQVGTFTPNSTSANPVSGVQSATSISKSLPIGFTFIYGSQSYTDFKMTSKGYITFDTSVTTANGTNNLETTTAGRPFVAPLWDNLNGTPGIASYQVTGSSPNRVLTVEWLEWGWVSSTTPSISFQVKLYETTNVIEFVYKQESGSLSSATASIGISDVSGSGSGSYLNLDSDLTNPSVTSTSSVTNINTKPADGQIFRFTPPSCMYMGTVTATPTSGTTATLNLSTAASVGIDVYVSNSGMPAPGATPTHTIPAGTTTLNLTNLTSSSTYTVYFLYTCSDGTVIGWFPYATFNTDCGIITGNIFEGFENATPSNNTTQNTVPLCWTYLRFSGTGYGFTSAIQTVAIKNGKQGFYIYAYNSEIAVVSPETNNLGSGTKQLRFSVNDPYQYDKNIKINVYSLDGNTSTSNRTLVQSISIKTTGWKEYIVPLPNTTDDYFAIAISGVGNNNSTYGHIDDVYYEDLWPCMFPGNVQVDPLSVTTTGADISWNASLDPATTGYEYEVRDASGNVVDSGSVTAPATSATAANLDPGTKYYVYVRTVCGTTTGDWTIAAVEFMTNCDIFPGNFFEGFENAPDGASNNHTYPDCWTFLNTRSNNTTYPWGYVYPYMGKSGSKSWQVFYYNYYVTAQTANNPFMLVSPETNNLGNGTKQLRFSLRYDSSYNLSGNPEIEIVSLDSNTAGATKTVIQTIQLTPNMQYQWVELIVPLPATTDDYFAFSVPHFGSTTNGSEQWYFYLDDIYYEDLMDCVFPTGITVNNITTTGASVAWNASLDPNATGYEYEVVDASGNVVASGTTTGTSLSLNGLTSATNYTLRLRSICGTTTGGWSAPVPFTTLCDVVTGNFFEGFEGYAYNHPAPTCWTLIKSSPNTQGYVYDWQVKTGIRNYYVYNYRYNAAGDFMLISPETQDLGNGTKQVRFSFYLENVYNTTAEMEIYSMDGNTATANKTLLQTITLNNQGQWKEYVVTFPATTDDYFAFAFPDNPGYWYGYIDDVYYEDIPPCQFPSNIEAINITTSSATINWDASLSPGVTGYEYEVRTSGAPGSGSGGLFTSGATTGTSVNLTGLNAATNYIVYVRAICGSDKGDWAIDPENFYTLCDVIMGSFFEGFENAALGNTSSHTAPYCWTYLKTGSNINYPAGYVATSYPNVGSKHFYVYRPHSGTTYAGESLLVSPETDNLGNGTKRLRFSARMLSVSASYGTSLSIYTMKGNTVGDIATKTLLKTIYLNSASYVEYVVYFPANTTDDYFAFSFDDESINKYIFLDDIYYEDLPSCVEVPEENITINKLTKEGFTVNWTDAYNNAAAYEIEVRTSGTPGTPGAVFSTTTLPGATSAVITGLDPSTAYQVYIRTMCSPLDTSVWSKDGVGTQTLCDYPTLTSYTESAVYCGPQKADLTATSDDSEATISWFDNENDIEPIYEGEHFISENEVTQDRSYWLRSRRVVNDTLLGIDYGTTTGATMATFLYGSYSALKHQYIFTAQELKDAGLGAGPIKALQFDVVSTGTRSRDAFTIYMGTTTQTTAATTAIPTGSLQLVYNSGKTQKFNTGLMTFNFTTPYNWDGVSNIVVQTNWANEATGATSGALRYHTTSQNRTTVVYTSDATVTAGTMLSTITNSGSVPYIYTTTYNQRPNTRFLGTFVCQSNAVEIPIEVQPKPVFELSTYKVTSCGGDTSEPVTIVTNFGGYDTFVWTPSTGVSGDAVSGWTFNTSIEQDYVLSATQSNGICEHLKTVRVFAGQKPIANPNLATLHEVCKNDIVTLDVLEKLPSDVTIGTGLTNTSSSSLTSAFVHSAEYSKQQYIYSASELMTQGLSSAGYITGLAFNTINSGASMTNANYTIKFASVSNTTFANDNFYTGSFTTVYSTPVHTHTFQGWQQINFDSPFYWDGQSNILVEITQEGIDASSNNAQTYYTPVTGSDVGLYAGAETEEDLATALGTRTETRLDARFSLQQATVQWSPATNLFVDAAATIPYTSGDSALTVYATSSTGGSFVYNALMTAPNGCAATQTYTVSVSDFGTPVVQDQTFCKTIAVTEVVVTGHQGTNLYFYDSATSNTPITNITRSGVYYVVSGQGDCKSARVAFNVTIVVLTNPTVKQFTQVICGNGTVADLEATGTAGAQIKWYGSATSTTPLSSTQTLVNNTTYYAAQALSGCESGRVAVLVNINPAPAALSPQSISICGGLNYADADLGQVAGSELVWYQSTTSQQPIPGTTQIVTGTYYVSQKVNGCESPRAQIIVTAQSGSVSAPTATTQNICGGGTVADLVAQTAPGGVALWYNSSTSTTPLQPTDVLSSGTYYVAQRVGNCLSSKTAVSVRIVNVTIPSVAPITLCEGATVADLNLQLSTPTGTSHTWYLNSTSTTPLDPTDVLSSGYYFVVRSQNSCESARVQVQVTINSRPSSPTGAPQQVFVDYAEIGYLEMDQTNVVWYLTYEDAMNGVNPLPANMPLVDKTTYYAVIIGSNGCPSLPTAVEVIITVGVNDFDLTQLKYYPNPTSDLLTISYNEPIVKVEVFDLNGRMVMNRDFDKETVELDFSRLSSGTYMLNIKTKDSSQFVKIIKK